MDMIIHYFSYMLMFLATIILAGMWCTSLIVSSLQGKYIIALSSFFIPPIGIVYISYEMLLESKGLDDLNGKDAFYALIKSFKKEDKCLLKNY